MIIQNPLLTGSLNYNGADLSNVTSSNANSASVSLILTAVSSSNQQLSASYIALSASYNVFSGSASTRITTISSSQQDISSSLLQVSASYIALSGSYNTFSGSASTRVTKIENNYATTGSNSFRADQSITGSLVVSSTITAQTLVVQTVTSSIVYSSGSNLFGNQLANTQTFTGSVNITGSLALAGNITGNAITLTGALGGTSATFSGTLTLNSYGNQLKIGSNGGTDGFIGIGSGQSTMFLGDYALATKGLTINLSTGAATFSNSITANATSTFSNASSLSAIFSNGGAVGNYNAIELRGGTAGTAVNWQISKDNSTSNAFELAASTTTGGTTYASPVFKILNTGVATFSGSVTTNSNLIVNKFSDSDYLALKIENRPITNNNTSAGYIGFYSNPGNGSNNTLSTSKIYGKFDTNSYPSARLTFSTVTGDDVYQDVMTLKNTNVGIGTISPGYTLDVMGTGRFSGGNLRFDNSSNSVYRGIVFGATLGDAVEYAYIKYQPQSGQLIFFGSPSGFGGNTLFQNNNATWLSVNSSNALSFTGATTFSSTITAGSDILATNSSVFAGSNNTTRTYMNAGEVGATYGATTKWIINRDGYAGDGSPALLMGSNSVMSGIGASAAGSSLFFTTNGSYGSGASYRRMTIDSSGNIGAPSGTNIYNASDIRLKQNVATITDGLNKIMGLNPVKFNWINNFVEDENDKDMLGFVAQEVQNIIPEAVENFGGGSIIVGETIVENPLRVNEKFIIPVLVKAIQELKATNDNLQAQINELKAI